MTLAINLLMGLNNTYLYKVMKYSMNSARGNTNKTESFSYEIGHALWVAKLKKEDRPMVLQ